MVDGKGGLNHGRHEGTLSARFGGKQQAGATATLVEDRNILVTGNSGSIVCLRHTTTAKYSLLVPSTFPVQSDKMEDSASVQGRSCSQPAYSDTTGPYFATDARARPKRNQDRRYTCCSS
jgi:hypothetical protein